MESSIHQLAVVGGANIGEAGQIGEFVVVQPEARVGKNARIAPHCVVESGVTVGDDVTIGAGVCLSRGLQIGHGVFIGPNVSFTEEQPRPRSGGGLEGTTTTICDHVSIGGGAVIITGVTIGSNAIISAGSLVTRSVPPNAIVKGNPARITGYVDAEPFTPEFVSPIPQQLGGSTTRVRGVTLHRFPRVVDMRGNLTVGEFERTVPFTAKRYFMVFDVPSAETRGEHSHRQCHQFLVCVRGSCSLVADDGFRREEFLLDRPDFGVHLPPLVWGIQYNYSPDAVLLVFASHYYDPADYIRDYSEFQRAVGAAP